MDSAWDGYINLHGIQFGSRGCVEHLPARYYYSLIELVAQSFSDVSVSYSSNGVYYSLSTEYYSRLLDFYSFHKENKVVSQFFVRDFFPVAHDDV